MPNAPTPPLDARGLPSGYMFKPDWEVTPRQFKTEWENTKGKPGQPLLLDCRRQDEWQVARIDGAVLIPMAEIERRADELESDDGSRSRPIVVHCHHGVRSMRVATTLKALGFTNVRSLAGGIDLWSIDIDPSVPRY